ncbi:MULTISPECIES: hypothetical protein [Serratia]|uniref:hypothetical protein n=1 Tax=Serratia TaxID=613 RepID=UPI000AD855EB|nr:MULTISPECIES: hypothetical protein [Serratia]MCW7606415.1 hypothetical protein [Serratia bockelmannii]MDX7543003.1 hypothetical protein [Serratia marcescens]
MRQDLFAAAGAHTAREVLCPWVSGSGDKTFNFMIMPLCDEKWLLKTVRKI